VSLETWKLICETLGILAVAASVLFGALALVIGNRINKVQSAQVRQFDERLTAAKTELGQQQIRAATAERDAADAKKAASDADAKAESFRLDIARANERAAEANKIAEQEHLARVRIEEKLAGWSMGAEAQARLLEKVRAFEGTPFDLGADPSAAGFMEVIDGILLAAKWKRQTPDGILLNRKARINFISGIFVEIASSREKEFRPAASALLAALQAEGIPAQGQIAKEEPDVTAIHIIIGSK
jgi:hypothetical protein